MRSWCKKKVSIIYLVFCFALATITKRESHYIIQTKFKTDSNQFANWVLRGPMNTGNCDRVPVAACVRKIPYYV